MSFVCVKISLKVRGDVTDVFLMRGKMLIEEEDAWFNKHSMVLLVGFTSDSDGTALCGGSCSSTWTRSVESQ